MQKKRPITTEDILRTIERRKIVRGKKVRWFLDGEDLELGSLSHCVRAKISQGIICPVTFYCFVKTGKFYHANQTDKAAKHSNMVNLVRSEIVDASDAYLGGVLRKKLLQASGLLQQARANGEKV